MMMTTLEMANDALRSAVNERLNAKADAEHGRDTRFDGLTVQDVLLAEASETYAEWQPPEHARQTGDGVMGERPIGSVEWLEAVEELRQLHFEKTAQYGDADPFANVTASAKCGVEPWRRALCDLSDCVVRMQRYANGQPVDYENALMDAANWALICLVKLRETK
jgi:hypothetical protein